MARNAMAHTIGLWHHSI